MNAQEKAKEIYEYWLDMISEQNIDHPNIHQLTKECCYTMIDIIRSSAFPNVIWGDYWMEVKDQVKWL